MRRGGGRARGRRGRPGSRRAAGAARPGGVRGGRARGGRGGLASGRARPARGAQRLCSVLQVYPEPRSEGECLSNIREFLRGCGASLRLEVRPARGGRAGGARGERGVGAATSPASRPPRRGGGSGGCGAGDGRPVRQGRLRAPWYPPRPPLCPGDARRTRFQARQAQAGVGPSPEKGSGPLLLLDAPPSPWAVGQPALVLTGRLG